MSFTITTDVFCDFCPEWMGDPGGVSGIKPLRRKAWAKAKYFGWKKIYGKHACPGCAVKVPAMDPYLEEDPKPEEVSG